MFLEHYSWLMECALNITHGQREFAEDLVHDVFLQFLDKDVDLASIGDVRGYLNGILRNLHLLQLRRTTRYSVRSFSLFDHDSVLVGLRARNATDHLQSADLLIRACDFACYRKESAITASILILRFFHGYYPGEIALLLKARRRAVDQWVERGRSETKQYLNSPYPLPTSGNTELKAAPLVGSANALLRCIRQRIFDSCTTGCSVLADDPAELGVEELAHLVSCRACLERRSRKLGLAHVAERMADDISDRDDGRPPDGSGGSGGIFSLHPRRKPSKKTILRRAEARRRELFEHRPKEISLVLDGQTRATLLVNAATNTLNLSLDRKEVPDSVAVSSEQDFHFLILDHDDLMCSERRVYRRSLSDDRLLEVSIIPETLGPSIQVVYEDPLLADEPDNAPVPEPVRVGDQALSFPAGSATSTTGSWWSALLKKLRSLVPAMNPLLASAIALGSAALICFVFWLWGTPTVSVGELLDHAQKAERSTIAANRPGVIREKVAIRTQRRSIERTIYRDAQGLRHPRRQTLSPEDEQLKAKLASAGVNWDEPLSASDYTEWRHRSGGMRDEVKRTGQHLWTLTSTPLTNGAVLKETLTVRDTDFHAVDRTVELQDSGTIEIAELNYDVLPWGAVNPDWFEPLSGEISAPDHLHYSSPIPHLPYLPSAAELDEAELSARLVLNRLHADRGEQIEVTRSGNGVQVKGIVESEARKQEIESRLADVQYVTPFILTFDDMERNQSSTGDITSIRTASEVRQPSPLELYLVPRGRSHQEVSQLAQDLVQAALAASRESKETADLLQKFSFTHEELTPRGHAVLAELVSNHRRSVEAALDREEQLLRSAGFVPTAPESAVPPDEQSGGFSHRAEENLSLCRELAATSGSEARPVASVIPELRATIARLRSTTRSISIAPDLANAANVGPSPSNKP